MSQWNIFTYIVHQRGHFFKRDFKCYISLTVIAAWQKKDIETRQAQSKYDRMPFYRKLFKKRPADAPQKPKRPEWIPNEKGEFDGYFQKHNPEDYENDINAALDRKEKYRKAKERYFGK